MFGLVHITSRISLTFKYATKPEAEQACERLNTNCSHVYYEVFAL
jgi:hypothetical protein